MNMTWQLMWKNFNPHSREGSDDSAQIAMLRSGDFNPHSREGSDWHMSCTLKTLKISIHTPAKGVT